MSRTQQLFNLSPVGVVNKEGFPAFKSTLEEDYLQMVMTNTIGNTFYANQRELFDKTMELHETMLKKDPVFMTQAAIHGRKEGLMRMQPIIATAFLSTLEDKKYFVKAFNSVVWTPGDLIDFITISQSVRPGKGFGRSIKRQVNNFLNEMDEYRAIKYGGDKQGWSLKDIIKVTHPRPLDSTQDAIFKYISEGTVPENLVQIQAVEVLKKLPTTLVDYEARVNYTIAKGRLPHEIVTGIVKPTQSIWEFIMREMPIFALTRNLNALDRASVFSKRENIEYVVGQLTNPDIIKRSKMLPFRFSTARLNFTGPMEISTALDKALELSIDNARVIPGRTAWFLDLSTSMTGEFLEIGTILGLAGLKQSQDSMLLGFANSLMYPRVDKDLPMSFNREEVRKVFGGGTNTSLTMDYLLGTVTEKVQSSWGWGSTTGYGKDFPVSLKKTEPTTVDNIVIITDEQQNSGRPLIERFRKYRETVNADAKLYIINVAPYSDRPTPTDEPGVTYVYGWSDSVLDILTYAISDGASHVGQVKQIEI